MKKRLILLYVFFYLCATTAFGEVLKVPVLLSHYIEHQENNSDITFAVFLYQHYQDDDGNDADNDRDEQLPFKSSQSTTLSIYSIVVPLAADLRLKPIVQNIDAHKVTYSEPSFSSPLLSNIWQPPKHK